MVYEHTLAYHQPSEMAEPHFFKNRLKNVPITPQSVAVHVRLANRQPRHNALWRAGPKFLGHR